MKTNAFTFAAITLLSVSCVPNESAVQIVAFSAIPESCDLSTGANFVAQTRGSLDLATGVGYFLDLRLRSVLEDSETSVGGDQIEGAGRKDFRATEMILSYRSEPSASFQEEVIPMFFQVPPGGSELSVLRANLIGIATLERLKTVVPVTPAGQPLQTTELFVTVQLRGALQNGAPIETNAATFPLTVFRTDFAGCPEGTTLAPTGPCGSAGGQDGASIACVAPTP